MAFTSTELFRLKTLNGVIAIGTYANTAGSTGGTITPSLSRIEGITLEDFGSATSSAVSVVNQAVADFPISGNSGVVVVNPTNASGTWIAFGV